MATGRSLPVYQKIYIDGYDMSGYAFDSGEQGVAFEENDEPVPFADLCKGAIAGKPTITFGPVNIVMDNTATTGSHITASAAQGSVRKILLARGVLGVPVIGDDVFCTIANQKSYKAVGTNIISATLEFSGLDVTSELNYDEFWGKLIHAWGSKTAPNTANTNVDHGGATTAGGWMMYQIGSITGTGTVTLSIDDSADGTTWTALSGATSGAIATASAPIAGIIQLSPTATVRRYLRHQIAFGGSATACTFALAFMRGR